MKEIEYTPHYTDDEFGRKWRNGTSLYQVEGTRFHLGKFEEHFVVLRSYDEGEGPTELSSVPDHILLQICEAAIKMGIETLVGVHTQMLIAYPCTRSYYIMDRMENLSEWIYTLKWRIDWNERVQDRKDRKFLERKLREAKKKRK